MTQPNLTEWDNNLATSQEEEYAALVRAIRWAKGFGLLFVQCSPVQGEQLIERIQKDINEKNIDVLRLDSEIDDLYETVVALPAINAVNILFVTGLEKSLVPYIRPGYGSEGEYYAKDSIPKILGKLNLQRELFKERFKLCFVFLVPHYAMKYLTRRAADFFDWRSGVWELVAPQEFLQQETLKVLREGNFGRYLSWTPQERRERCLAIEDLLTEGSQGDGTVFLLRIEQGNIFTVNQDYRAAIDAYDEALEISPDNDHAWHNRGWALDALGRHEEAIASYDKALNINANNDNFWYNRGWTLRKLGRHEEAIASYDKALEINPTAYDTWYNRGISLGRLGRHEDSIASYNKGLDINPGDHQAWYNRGNELSRLGQYEEAIDSYNKGLDINPDNVGAWINRGIALCKLGRYEEAIASYDKVLDIKPNSSSAWNNRGYSFLKYGKYLDAKESLNKALELNPSYNHALESMACYFLLQDNIEQALTHLSKSIELDDGRKLVIANDPDFATLHNDPRFQALIGSTD